MADRLKQYRAKIVQKYQVEFGLHGAIATMIEKGLFRTRSYPTNDHTALDMLMIQSLKAHAAVSLLAQHGLMEDCSTMARRLLELSVQAVYIGMEEDQRERRRRSGAYLAFMWRQLPDHVKRRLSPDRRAYWVGIARGHGRHVKRNAKRWGPDFRTMFRAVNAEDLYVEDYTFLSSIAHGTADHQIFQYSSSNIRVHTDEFVPISLIYASRYFMAAAEAWNRTFGLLDENRFDELTKRVTE
jgi:hypothetical protein